MPGVQIYDPTQGQESPLDALAKAVGIATTIYGVKLKGDELDIAKNLKDQEAQKLALEQKKLKGGGSYIGEYIKEGHVPVTDVNKLTAKQKENLYQLPVFDASTGESTLQNFIPKPKAPDELADTLKQMGLIKTIQDIKKGQEEEQNVKPDQAAAAGYAKRLTQAANNIVTLEQNGLDTGSLETAFQQGKFVPEAIKDPKIKLLAQAQANIVNAILRRESGAAISQSEFESAAKQYFAQPGDTDDVKAQKRQNLESALDAVKLAAGPKALEKIGMPELKPYEKIKEKAPPHGNTVIQNGFTYTWNPQTGKYE